MSWSDFSRTTFQPDYDEYAGMYSYTLSQCCKGLAQKVC